MCHIELVEMLSMVAEALEATIKQQKNPKTSLLKYQIKLIKIL